MVLVTPLHFGVARTPARKHTNTNRPDEEAARAETTSCGLCASTATTLAISSEEQRMFQFCEAARRESEDRRGEAAAGFSFAVVGALTAFVMNTLRRAYVVMRAAVVAVGGWVGGSCVCLPIPCQVSLLPEPIRVHGCVCCGW